MLTSIIHLTYNKIDKEIEGKWRDYPPFSYLNHPHPDYHLEDLEITSNYGFNSERHYVTTEDGYINMALRINKFDEKRRKDGSRKPAVMLVHGHLDSSDTWIANTPNSSLGMVLASAGYDVWMVNTRGNKYSEGHVKYNANTDYDYWDGCHPDNYAQYDIPAFIDYIKRESNV